MLRKDEWYYVPLAGEEEVMGTLLKILSVEDNTLYAAVESWNILRSRKFRHIGTNDSADVVFIQKYGMKVEAPPKMFEVLYSETVNQKLDSDQTLDTENEYTDD